MPSCLFQNLCSDICLCSEIIILYKPHYVKRQRYYIFGVHIKYYAIIRQIIMFYSPYNTTVKEVDTMTTQKEIKVIFNANGKSLSDILKQILISKAR